jgi:deferrochelatase/peroxidase EfeB
MDKFPDWASRWLSKDTRQVSHGLNLALKLENPDKLPLLLWDIVVAQPKITRAMKELSFIHFARFVPSWDGTALMVTTEFDGPLEPYVMDFVIALGDVFDTLLSYVDPNVRPKLPTSEHPAEFWTFVQEWNRVPFARRIGGDDTVLFPPDFDYPLYSAYPEKTVTDILGKRTKLLPPAIDHPAAYVDLNDVQGNILNAYRAETAAHLFFSISDHLKARSWLATVFPQKGGNAWDGVMSAERWGVLKPTVMANVGLTYAGMKKLLPDRMDDLRKFPDAFREGAEKRGELNGDKGLSDPRYWLFGRDDQNIHVVLSLYTFEKKVPAGTPHTAAFRVFIDAFDALRKAALDNGMKLVCKQDAQALAGGKEQFGYTDGISKPRISGQCKPDDPDFQPAASPGEFLLGKDYKSIFGGSSLVDLPGDLAQNGTFGALRLLEQDVTAFKAMVKAEAARLAIPDEELLKAKLLGRWPQGEPLALDPEAPSGYVVNSFDYAPSWEHPGVDNDHEGAQCPIGAHIRRTNPRTARVAGQRHSRRLIRRGMPTDWVDADGTKKVGLLGLFIGASLERQFEFIQRQWIQGDLAASGIRGTQDPIAGLRSKPTRLRIRGNDDSDANTVIVPPLVTTRGSLYLFFPGISMLRGLEEAATPSSLRELNE